MVPRIGFVALCATSFAFTSAVAQQEPVRVRGTIEQVSGSVLTVKSREGDTLNVKLADDAKVLALVKASPADIKPGSYVGATAMPNTDGTWWAVEVHIFPDSMRGVGLGDRAWDLKPKSTMTNGTVGVVAKNRDAAGTVGGVVAKTEGPTLTVEYQNHVEKKIGLTPDTVIVSFVPGSKDELRPGAKIFIAAATRQGDGSLMTARINVGRDVAPPM
ncbi:MAG TPA: hypothetical protein VGF53_12575 [Pseudolabrys sp.]|jgi:hypothetical protein